MDGHEFSEADPSNDSDVPGVQRNRKLGGTIALNIGSGSSILHQVVSLTFSKGLTTNTPVISNSHGGPSSLGLLRSNARAETLTQASAGNVGQGPTTQVPKSHDEAGLVPCLPQSSVLPAVRGISSDYSPSVTTPKETATSLWDEAYESLRGDDQGLSSWYETILSQDLWKTSLGFRAPEQISPGTYANLVSPDSAQSRRAQMKALVDLWLADVVQPAQDTQEDQPADPEAGMHKLSKSLRDSLRDSIESTRADAVLVWAAACYAAEKVFLHPQETSEDDAAGLVYVISRIEWYCRLLQLLPVVPQRDDAAAVDTDGEKSGGNLGRLVVSLYRAVLSYLMSMVCLHWGTLDSGIQSSGIRPGVNSYRPRLGMVKAAENAMALDGGVRVKARLEKVLDAARKSYQPKKSPSNPSGDGAEDSSEQPGGTQQEKHLSALNITDPRLSVPKLRMGDQRDPTHVLYHALLSTPQYSAFRRWNKDDAGANRLLFVSGGPGQGKTMLLTGMVQTQLAGRAHTKGYDPRQLAFFFFDSSQPETDHAAAALRHLIWLLLDAQPVLSRHLEDQIAMTSREQFNHPGDFLALSSVFYSIVQDDALKETYLIVDALDECSSGAVTEQPGLDDFVRLIAKSLTLSQKVRWMVSGDDTGALGELLLAECAGSGWLHLDLGSGLGHSQVAFAMYIDSKVEELADVKQYDDGLRKQIAQRLCNDSQGNYLWVSIACSSLRAEKAWYALNLLEDVSSRKTVGQLYEHMYDGIQCLRRQDGRLCIQVLSTMALATEPIAFDELKALVGLDKRHLRSILRKCSAFLREVRDVVVFLHPSAKRYILCLDTPLNTTSELHSTLTQRCLDHLGSTLAAVGSGAMEANARYSALNWITHLTQVSQPTHHADVKKRLEHFFHNYFLSWVDHLARHDQLHAAAARLERADRQLGRAVAATSPTTSSSSNDTLQAAIRDACLFICLHLSTGSPAGVFARNTLLFCPEESLIRKLSAAKALPWLASASVHRHWARELRGLRGHEDWVRCVEFSADGRLLISGSDDSTVRIWDVQTGETQQVMKVDRGWVYSVAICTAPLGPGPRPRRYYVVAAGSDDGSVTLWNAETGQRLKTLKDHPGSINSLAFSSDGKWLAVASASEVRVWDMEALDGNAELKDRHIPHDATVRSVVFSPSGQLLLTGADDANVRLWDLERTPYELKHQQSEAQAGIREDGGAQGLPDGSQEANQTERQQFSINNGDSNLEAIAAMEEAKGAGIAPSPLCTFGDHKERINGVAFSADSKLIASCSDDGTCRVWQLGSEESKILYTLRPSRPPSALKSIALFQDRGSSYLASSGADKFIDIWDLNTGQHVQAARSRSWGRIFCVAFAPNGAYFATGHGTSNTVGLWYTMPWDPSDRNPSAPVSHTPSPIALMALSPDGRTLATSDSEGDVALWDALTGKLLNGAMNFEHTGELCSMAFSPRDGMMLLTGSSDCTVGVCKVPQGDRLNRFSGHSDWVRCVAWTPNAQYAASGSDDSTIRIWEVGGSDDQESAVLRIGDSYYVMDLAFSTSPGKTSLVSCGTDGKIRIWNAADLGVAGAKRVNTARAGWQLQHTIEATTGGVYRIVVSLDSQRVVSLDDDDMLRVWDMESGQPSEKYPATEFKATDRWLRLWFDSRSEDHVMSAYGAQSLTAGASSSAFSRPPQCCRYRIVADGTGRYVTRDGKKLIFCPGVVGIENAHLVGEDAVVFGLRDGSIRVFRFEQDVVTRDDYVHVVDSSSGR